MTYPTLRRAKRMAIISTLFVGAFGLAGCGSAATTTAPGGSVGSTPATATTAAGGSVPATTAGTTNMTCPTALLVTTASTVTYTGPQSAPGADPSVLTCEYDTQGTTSMAIDLYAPGTSLKALLAGDGADPAATTAVSGLGDSAAALASPNAIFVSRSSAPSFYVIDQAGMLTPAQVEAVAKAVASS